MQSMPPASGESGSLIDLAKDMATALGDQWGVGNRGCDDGIVLLVSKADRVAYLRTAAGAQQALPDETAHIVVDAMRPAFRQGNFDKGPWVGSGQGPAAALS